MYFFEFLFVLFFIDRNQLYQKNICCRFFGGIEFDAKNISNSFITSEFSGMQSSCANWVVLNIQDINIFLFFSILFGGLQLLRY